MPLGYSATLRRHFTFYHYVLRNSWFSFDQLRKDERLSQTWSHLVALKSGLLGWESSALTSKPLLHYPFLSSLQPLD